MKDKKKWVTYLSSIAMAAAIVLLTVYFEADLYGKSTSDLLQFFSDGFFTAAVLFLGSNALVFISEAGNFYGIQYLGYSLVRIFSFRKDRFEDRKDYFTYCTEKKEKLKEQGKSTLKWALLYVGLGCLLFSVLFAVCFYGSV